MQAVKLPSKSLSLRYRVHRPSQRFTHVVKANKGQNIGDALQSVKAPLAALCAAALLTGAIVPEEALAARSGGRVGGSSFSARRSAPSAPRAGPSSSGSRAAGRFGAASSRSAPSVRIAPPRRVPAPSRRTPTQSNSPDASGSRSSGRFAGAASRSAPSIPVAPPSFAPAPSRRVTPSQLGPTIRNYNYYAPPPVVAPPLIGGFGFPGFGYGYGGGVAVGPAVVVPGFGFISSLFSLFFLIITLSFILNVIRGIVNNKSDRYDD